MTENHAPRTQYILGLAIALTTAAELFYLLVWGVWLFPQGSLAGKTVWTMTCGLAMGSVIGALVLVWAEPARGTARGFWRAFLVAAGVASYCAWLCSRIDARFDYFGGAENGVLFVAGGVVPALLGGWFYAWALYRRRPADRSQRAQA